MAALEAEVVNRESDYIPAANDPFAGNISAWANPCPGSDGTTIEQREVAGFVAACMQMVIGLLGILGNLSSIYILSSTKRLKSAFNFMLILNLLLQTAYILVTFSVELYEMFPHGESPLFHTAFSNFLYPARPLFLHASTFLTMFMARERLNAIKHPLEYRGALLKGNNWPRALRVLLLSVIVSTLFVMPLLWETSVVETKIKLKDVTNDTLVENITEQTVSRYELTLTELRFNHIYYVWYKCIATFVITLLAPLISLGYFNVNTYILMREYRNREPRQIRLELRFRHQYRSIKKDEERKARVLFVIILNFLVWNIPRFILNLEEVLTMNDYKLAYESKCVMNSLWLEVTHTVSKVLLCLNASIGFAIYCIMSKDFRDALRDKLGFGNATGTPAGPEDGRNTINNILMK